MTAVTGNHAPKRRHVDHGSAVRNHRPPGSRSLGPPFMRYLAMAKVRAEKLTAETSIHVRVKSSLLRRLPPVPRRRAPPADGATATAAAVVSVSLPTDVIFEMLSWLPVKSLCRFRCVSKQWRAIISDPAFHATHEPRAEPLLVSSFDRGTSLQLTDMDGHVVRRMKGVDGPLTFCSSVSCYDDLACFDDVSPNPQVIDLATGDMLLSRSNPEEPMHARRWHSSWCTFGFGRTALSRLYKVVRINEYQDSCSVLTVGDGAGWRRTKAPTSLHTLSYQHPTIDGVMYFLVIRENKILCFDLENEEWNGEIVFKTEISPPYFFLPDVNMAKLNGALCVSQTKVTAAAQAFTDVWLLTDSEKSVWSKVYTIRTSPSVHLVKPLRILRDGRKLLFSCTRRSQVRSEPMLQVYDPCLDRCSGETVGLADTIGVCNLRLGRFVSVSI